jgi:hypothetical protein
MLVNSNGGKQTIWDIWVILNWKFGNSAGRSFDKNILILKDIVKEMTPYLTSQ